MACPACGLEQPAFDDIGQATLATPTDTATSIVMAPRAHCHACSSLLA